MSDNQLAVVNVSSDFLMPAAPLDVVLAAFQMRKDFIEKVLKLDTDYGIIPGTKKPVLLKPGAEKMTSFFALTPVFEDVQVVEDWTGASHNSEPFFYYRQKCKLYHGERLIATADGSCNSQENKYRFRWVGIEDVPESLKSTKLKTQGGKISEFAFAVEKAETSGKYGKPAEYWKSFQDAIANHTATAITRTTSKGKEMDAWEIGATLYRIPNEEISEVVNTILKMAQKRALIAAVLIATNTSDHFTQDMDDFASQASVEGVWHDVTPEPVKTVDPATGEIKPAAPTPTNGSGHGEQAKMTIETAESEFSNSAHSTYGMLSNEVLSQHSIGLGKLAKQTDESRRKMEAIKVILAARAAGRPVQEPVTPEAPADDGGLPFES